MCTAFFMLSFGNNYLIFCNSALNFTAFFNIADENEAKRLFSIRICDTIIPEAVYMEPVLIVFTGCLGKGLIL